MRRRSFISVLGSSLSAFTFGESPNKGLPDEDTGIYRVSREIRDDTIRVTYPPFPNSLSQRYLYSRVSNKNLTLDIDRQKYLDESNKSKHFYMLLQQLRNSDWMVSMTDSIVPSDSKNTVSSTAKFVQQFEYETDLETTGSLEYTRHPVELLVDGVGDCDCRTTFLYSILYHLGYTVGFVQLPYHVGVIVPVEELSSDIQSLVEPSGLLTFDSVQYAYIEPNSVVLPGRYDISKENVILYETVDKNITLVNPEKITEQVRKTISVIQDSI